MASTFKKGDVVRLVTVIPEGPVKSIRMSDDGVVSYLIEWEDELGNNQQRWFEEDQLALVAR
jgi:uncharacterized protein YodC (DUF2158 family)